jgi:hypothetical protein
MLKFLSSSTNLEKSIKKNKIEVMKGSNQFSIELQSDLSDGIYYLKIFDSEGNSFVEKLIHSN